MGYKFTIVLVTTLFSDMILTEIFNMATGVRLPYFSRLATFIYC